MILQIKAAIITGSLVLAGVFAYLGYSKVYNAGYAEAEAKYQAVITQQNKMVATIESDLQKLVITSMDFNSSLSSDLDAIKAGMKNKPLVIYKEGKCTIAKEFLDSRDAAIDRANQR